LRSASTSSAERRAGRRSTLLAVTDIDAPKFALSRLAGGAFFTDADGRVLFVRPTYKDY
jgi:hypothetical protein